MVQQALERYRNDALYFEEHREEFFARYPEEWIAIYNKKVVGASGAYQALLAKVEEAGVPLESVFIERATHNEDILIL